MDWGRIYEDARTTAATTALGADDLEQYATAAYLLGHDEESHDLRGRLFQLRVDAGEPTGAARAAFWLGMALAGAGEQARAGGWFARATRVLDDAGLTDCPERGFLLLPTALQALFGGDADGARAVFRQAAELAAGDRDLLTLARLGEGQALVGLERTVEGLSLLDEAMVGVVGNEVTPMVAGLVYCAVIIACQRVHDLSRAEEWTAALSRWCETQQGMVPYRGQCLVHRSEVLAQSGSWAEAMLEATRALERLSDPPGQTAVGLAHYQVGELHRLRGEHAVAEQCFQAASRAGHDPQPGLALLRLAQGRPDSAAAAIARLLDPVPADLSPPRLLAAHVEASLARGDLPAARAGADRLGALAREAGQPWLGAVAADADGAVRLAEGDAVGAHRQLIGARRAWQELGLPYETARNRVHLAGACRALGDEDGALLELDAARATFEQLGAATDLALLETVAAGSAAPPPAGLSRRELEVLRLVAGGLSNRAVADRLVLSEKTVARHVSNIFTKLGVSSRSAATAYAFRHDLV